MAKSRKATELEKKKQIFSGIASNLEEVTSGEFLKSNFLPYAWSVTLQRAITDVSGLKPVQKRVLFTMYRRGLSPNAGFHKVATLAGATLAYHPHGDASVEDALKNLARPTVFRVPLIEGKGDFGDGGRLSPGAAGRYIEARLSEAGWINIEELKENAIEMIPNYDSTELEPSRLPVRWPVSVINGSSGIAVGFASNIPSHNPTEIMKATQRLLKNPEISDEELLKIVRGPDFNSGGLIISNDGVKEYIKTGSGTFRIRGKYRVTPLPRGRTQIEFYELPYGVRPGDIIERVQKEIQNKDAFKDISSYKDLSGLKNPTLVVFETKAGVPYQTVIAEIFKRTQLESSFPANLTTIINDRPVQVGIRELLLNFIEFRKEISKNKFRNTLENKEARLHLVEGLLKVLIDIDKAIEIIRRSNNPRTAGNNLRREFRITEKQADHILKLQLQRLTRMDRVALDKEDDSLNEEIKRLNQLLTDEGELINYLHIEFDETIKIIGDERRTEIMDGTMQDFKEIQKERAEKAAALSENVVCYVSRLSNGNVVKTLEKPYAYNIRTAKTLRNAPIIETIKAMTEDDIVLIGDDGVGHRVPLSFLANNRVQTANQIGITLGKGVELVGIAKSETKKDEVGVAIGTKNGLVKISRTDFPTSLDTFPVINLKDDDEVLNCAWIDSEEERFFTFITTDSSILTFSSENVRPSGSRAGGMIGIKLRKDQDAVSFNSNTDLKEARVLSQAESALKMTPLSEVAPKGRGGMGMILQRFGKDDSKITASWAGINPIIVVRGKRKIVQLPNLSKRATTGTPCPFPCEFGSTNPIP